MTTGEPTTGEIVRALRDAPNYNGMAGTTTTVEDIAADRLEQQEQRIAELEREIAAAKEDMNKVGNCTLCAKNCKPSEIVAIVGNGEKCFEWRGLPQEGEGKENG